MSKDTKSAKSAKLINLALQKRDWVSKGSLSPTNKKVLSPTSEDDEIGEDKIKPPLSLADYVVKSEEKSISAHKLENARCRANKNKSASSTATIPGGVMRQETKNIAEPIEVGNREITVEQPQGSGEIARHTNFQARGPYEEIEENEDSLTARLMSLALASDHSQLSEQEINLNLQEQADEILALQAIYEDKFQLLDQKEGQPSSFMISVSLDITEPITCVVHLPSLKDGISTSEPSARYAYEERDSHSNSSIDSRAPSNSSYTFSLNHLPPLCLLCVLPVTYPSQAPPFFALSALWLSSSALSGLCSALDKIWQDQMGQVVVYAWTEWLQSQTLFRLEEPGRLILGSYLAADNSEDCRAVSGFSSTDSDVLFLIRYNEEMKRDAFRKSLHLCNICFVEYFGKDFARFPCQHAYCWTCMQQYVLMHVKDGTVNKLKCPDPSCKGSIPPFLLKELLGDEEFQRWESLMLQKTLDAMADVVYCPRCETVCIEDKDHHALCAKCFFSFCTLCRRNWHVGQQCMSSEAILRILQERRKGSQAGEAQRKQEEDILNDILSLNVVNREAKQCPNCRMAISKSEGCNKMTCSYCGSFFCFKCGKQIEGYDHFGSECVLFEEQEIQRWEEQFGHRDVMRQAELGHGKACPNCRQVNVKVGCKSFAVLKTKKDVTLLGNRVVSTGVDKQTVIVGKTQTHFANGICSKTEKG